MEELLNKPEFQCILCKKLLSHPPIMLTERGDNVCGRCYNNRNVRIGLLYHNKTYEELASVVKFTCRYVAQGCTEELYLHETEVHEKYCEYRVYNCPILPKGICEWTGTWSGLREHCKNIHRNLVIDYPWRIKLDLTADNDRNIFLIVRGILFVMQIKYNARLKKLWHLVQFMGNPALCCSQLEYDLKIINNDSVVKYNNPVATQDDIDMNTGMSVETSTVEFSTSCEAELHFCCKKKLNPVLIKLFTCAECGDICLYNFTDKNKIICCGCKPVMYPAAIKLQRNKLIIVLVYPCDNKIKGCDYFDFESKMKKHKSYFCKYSRCYLCSEPYNEDVLQHYITKHSDIVCYSNKNLTQIANERNYFIMVVYNYIFICEYIFHFGLYVSIYSNVPDDRIQSFQWAIEIIDPCRNINKREFKFTPDDFADWELALHADEWGPKLGNCTFNYEIMKKCENI